VIRLPDSLRGAFKEPFGPVYTDPTALLSAIDETAASAASDDPPLIAVGDVVTYHLLEADRQPDVAVIDGQTEREAVDQEIAAGLADPDGDTRTVENPPAAISEALLGSLRQALDSPELTTITVDGEEDLATLPAIGMAPLGASVIYGQPGTGMVHVPVTDSQQARARRLLEQFEGDTEAALAVADTSSK